MSRRLSTDDFEALQERMRAAKDGAAVASFSSQRREKQVRGKYGNKKVQIDGITFDSKDEGRRYQQLKFLEERGLISELRCQVSFELAPSVHLRGRNRMSPPLRYFADFVYVQDGHRVVEDVKGMATEGYRIKRHLMATVHGIQIVEIRQGGK